MTSPTSHQNLHGASCVTGRVFHGCAQGNVFNNADADEVIQHNMQSNMGKVQVYVSHVDPTTIKPKWSLKHQVTPKLKPVLKALSRHYSPIRSKIFILSHYFTLFFLELNQCIFVYDDEWIIRGRYSTALEDSEDLTWAYENGQDFVQLLIVSTLLFISMLN